MRTASAVVFSALASDSSPVDSEESYSSPKSEDGAEPEETDDATGEK